VLEGDRRERFTLREALTVALLKPPYAWRLARELEAEALRLGIK
jgi:hypothetical protein